MENKKNNIPKILIVEDDKVWFDLLKLLVSMNNLDLDMTYAWNGQVAVDMLAAGEKFDAILMNIEMPSLDGLMATREIRKNDPSTPVIAWTCHDQSYIGKNCKSVGMNDFIEKDAGRLVIDIVESLRKFGISI
ncbi:MAG: response regulator [Bacteroidota bacterium]